MKSSQCLTGRKWVRSSVPTQIRDIYHFQRTVQFRHRSLQSLLSMYSMVCWWQISYEYGFHLNGKRFLEVYVKNHWKADRLASFKFLWDPVWLSGESTPEAPCSQIRILKFSNSQKFRCDKKVCQPELDKNKHWPHVFNRLADGVFFFQISKFHLCIIKKRNIQQTYYLSNVWPAH